MPKPFCRSAKVMSDPFLFRPRKEKKRISQESIQEHQENQESTPGLNVSRHWLFAFPFLCGGGNSLPALSSTACPVPLSVPVVRPEPRAPPRMLHRLYQTSSRLPALTRLPAKILTPIMSSRARRNSSSTRSAEPATKIPSVPRPSASLLLVNKNNEVGVCPSDKFCCCS